MPHFLNLLGKLEKQYPHNNGLKNLINCIHSLDEEQRNQIELERLHPDALTDTPTRVWARSILGWSSDQNDTSHGSSYKNGEFYGCLQLIHRKIMSSGTNEAVLVPLMQQISELEHEEHQSRQYLFDAFYHYIKNMQRKGYHNLQKALGVFKRLGEAKFIHRLMQLRLWEQQAMIRGAKSRLSSVVSFTPSTCPATGCQGLVWKQSRVKKCTWLEKITSIPPFCKLIDWFHCRRVEFFNNIESWFWAEMSKSNLGKLVKQSSLDFIDKLFKSTRPLASYVTRCGCPRKSYRGYAPPPQCVSSEFRPLMSFAINKDVARSVLVQDRIYMKPAQTCTLIKHPINKMVVVQCLHNITNYSTNVPVRDGYSLHQWQTQRVSNQFEHRGKVVLSQWIKLGKNERAEKTICGAELTTQPRLKDGRKAVVLCAKICLKHPRPSDWPTEPVEVNYRCGNSTTAHELEFNDVADKVGDAPSYFGWVYAMRLASKTTSSTNRGKPKPITLGIEVKTAFPSGI